MDTNFFETKTAVEIMDRMNLKLDLMLELIEAKDKNETTRIKEICEKLDSLKVS